MESFNNQVVNYVGTIADTDGLSDFLTHGARWFAMRLPEERLVTTDLATGLTGVSIDGYRFFRGHKSGYEARIVNPGLKTQLADSNSIYKASATNPKAYIENGEVYIEPGGGTAIVYQYPTVVYTDTTITGFPRELYHGVVLYAAIHSAVQIYNARIASLNAISTPTTSFSLTVANAHINTDEDIELGNTELNQQKTYLEKFGADLSKMGAEVQQKVAEITKLGDLIISLRNEFKEFVASST